MVEYSSGFIGKYSHGDNIVYNLKIINRLYEDKIKNPSDECLYVKPIIISMSAVVEAVLKDFFYKVDNFTTEGVGDIEENILNDIRLKVKKNFYHYIDIAKKT